MNFKSCCVWGYKALNNSIYNKVPVFATIGLSTLVMWITSKNNLILQSNKKAPTIDNVRKTW